jgi:hypothetical protein
MNAIGVRKSVALIRGFDVARDQLAETKAVEVGYAAKVENDILTQPIEQSANGVSKGWCGSS